MVAISNRITKGQVMSCVTIFAATNQIQHRSQAKLMVQMERLAELVRAVTVSLIMPLH